MNQPAPSNREKIAGFLGERAERRMPPSLADALAAAGGVLVAAGLVVIGFDQLETNGSNVTGIVLSLLVVAAAIVVPYFAPARVLPGCVAALVVGAPALWFFLVVAESTTGSTSGASVGVIITFSVLFLVGPTRGRIALFAAALFWLSGWIVEEIVGFDSTSFDPGNLSGDGGPYDLETASIVSLFVGGAMLVGGWAFDRQRLSGLATPFLVIGAITALSGAATFSVDNELAPTGLLVLLAGVGIAMAAIPGPERRATTWLGAVAAVFGLFLVILDAADDSAITFGIVAAIVGVGVTALTLVLPPWLRPNDPDPGPPMLPGPAPQ